MTSPDTLQALRDRVGTLLCRDCKWLRRGFLAGRINPDLARCNNPQCMGKEERARWLVDGRLRFDDLPYASHKREYGPCGNGGQYFQPRKLGAPHA